MRTEERARKGLVEVDDVVTVQLIGVPVALVARAREHWDALIRELAIIAMDDLTETRSNVPDRLSSLARNLARDNAMLIARDLEAIDRAVSEGRETMDLAYVVPRVAGDICRRLDELLDEADNYCRAEKLLTPPAPADIRAYRRWLYAEFVRQCAGDRARPWLASTA